VRHIARHKSLLHTVRLVLKIKYDEFEDRPIVLPKTSRNVKVFLTED